MDYLSNRIKGLSESQTIAMNRMSRELKEKGVDVISLSLGEPDFDTPKHIKEAAKKAIDENYTHYPPVAGYPALRKAISEKFKRENNLNYAPEQIVVSTGAKQSIANIVLSLVNPGDEVIIPTPYWVSYLEIVKLAEGRPVFVYAGIEKNFKISAAQLEAAITDKTKLVIYSSPSNPTGSLYTKDELEAFATVLEKYPYVYVISDEIYEHVNFEGKHESIAQFENIREQVIVVNGVSKAYAMTGWRIGYIGAPLWIAKACDKMQGQITSGASSISQMAAIAAVNSPPEVVEEMTNIFKKRRDMVLELLREIKGMKTNVPPGAFYIFTEISDYFGKTAGEWQIENSTALCMYLLNEAHVGLVPGEAFGAPDYLRISYAASEETLREAIRRIKEALEKLTVSDKQANLI